MTTSRVLRAAAPMLAVVLATFAALAAGADATAARAAHIASDPKQDVGLFTGTFANGMPLYRLPPINVVTHRNVEVARMEREEQQARIRQMSAAEPPQGANSAPVGGSAAATQAWGSIEARNSR